MTKIRTSRQLLIDALAAVEPAVPKKTPRAILQNVLIEQSGSAAILRATDLEVAVRYSIPVIESGSAVFAALVPAGRLRSILSEVTGSEITLSIEAEKLHIDAGFASFTLPTQDVAEFPAFAGDRIGTPFEITLKGAALSRAIRRTIWATDPESSRYALAGIKLEAFADRANFVATDSRRLSIESVVCGTDGQLPEVQSLVIPAKSAAIVDRLAAARPDADVKIELTATSAMFHVGDQAVSTRLVEGRFPNYRDIVPQSAKAVWKLSIPSGPWLAAIRQSMITTNEESRGVDFKFDAGKLVLQSSASDVGASRIELPIDNSDKEIPTFTLDPRFVADFLKSVPPETSVDVFLTDSESAVLLEADAGNYQYVVMPLSRDR